MARNRAGTPGARNLLTLLCAAPPLDGAVPLQKAATPDTGLPSFDKSGSGSKPAITKLALPAVDGKRILADGLAFERPLELLAGSVAAAPPAGDAAPSTTTLWLSDNFNNRIHKLSVSAASAAIECTVTSPLLRTPTTLAIQGGYLWAMNARLLECPFLLSCSWQKYEVVGSPLSALCV